MNDDKARLRRYEDNLYVSGMGVIILGLWDVIRPVMQIIFGSPILSGFENLEGDYVNLAVGIFIFLLIILIVLFGGLHLFTGLNAIRAAKGKKYNKGYFVSSIIMLSISALAFIGYKDTILKTENIGTFIASLLVDVTMIYIFITLIRSTIKIKKLKQKAEQEVK